LAVKRNSWARATSKGRGLLTRAAGGRSKKSVEKSRQILGWGAFTK